ncbi:MAG: hypothetical protein J07HQX50_01538, partial [Haloquadratum sp. J07HQX50]
RRHDHAQQAPCHDLLERLHAEGVDAMYVGDLTDIVDTHWPVETPSHTTAGCSENSPNSWPVPPRNTVPRSKSSRKCGRVKSTRSVAVQTERHGITRLRVHVRVRGLSRLRNILETAHRAGSQADAWHGPCGSSGAITTDRNHHIQPSQPTVHRPECRPQ